MTKKTLSVNNVQQSIDTKEREDAFNQRRAFGHEEEYAKNRKEWEENPEKHIVAEYPLHVDIELSSVCNLNCPMCYTITDHFKKKVKAGFMDFELYKKIIDEIAPGKVFSIRLSLRGESTLHKQFIECIKYAKNKGIKEVSMLTNGKKFANRDFCKRVIDAGIDWITVSIDGVDAVYENIRRPITFEEIKLSLKNIIEIRKKQHQKKPAIKIQGVWPAVKENTNKYIDTFSPLSDLLYVNPIVDYLDNDKAEQIEYIPNFTCYQPFQRLVITSNGKATMCANDQMSNEIIGDAYKMTVYELWHSDKMRRAREDQINNMALEKYNTCEKCQVPRSREYEEATIQNKKVFIENYTHRIQMVGR